MAATRDPILKSDTGYAALYTKVNNDMTELFAIAAEVEAGRDGESSLLVQINKLQASILALSTGSGCPVSANDASAGYLNGKLLAGEGVDFTEGDDGGDETLTISCEDASDSNKGIASFSDTDFVATDGAVSLSRDFDSIGFFNAIAF